MGLVPANVTRAVRNLFGGISGPRYYNSDKEGNVLPEQFSSGLYPFQGVVLNKIANLASQTKLTTNSMWFGLRPQKYTTVPQWLQKVTYTMLKNEVVSIVAVRDYRTNKITEYHVFEDTFDNFTDGGPRTFVDQDQTYTNIPRGDVLQFSFSVDPYFKALEATLQKAELAYWRTCANADRMRGIAGWDNAFSGRLPSDQELEVMKTMSSDISSMGMGILPTAAKFTSASLLVPLHEHQEVILRNWCHFYSFPTSLMNIDLPSHTDVSHTAAYGNFVRMTLAPMLNAVFAGISYHSGFALDADYTRVEKASDGEESETRMKQAQSGIYTINELRNKEGLEPIKGGDELASAAGNNDPEENKGDKEKKINE